MVRLAVEELIERLDITKEVLKNSDTAGVESLIEAVDLAKQILAHYVRPFSMTNMAEVRKHLTGIDKP